MHWIIQRDFFSEPGQQALFRALRVMGLPHGDHAITPNELTLNPDVEPHGKVIALGAHTMMQIAQAHGWTPGVYLTPGLDFGANVAAWGERMLNHDAWVGALSEVPHRLGAFFIRPTFDSKRFYGRVVDWAELEELRSSGRLAPDTSVVVASKKILYGEWRTWIVAGRLVTASQYRQGAEARWDADVPDGILAFAQECADVWTPARAFVLDIASTPDGLKIIEVNCINAASWYHGNVGKVVAALEELESGPRGDAHL